MPAGKFEVDPDLLHSGGDSSRFAGDAARKAAGRLAESNAPRGIFGDFDAAHSFHTALTAGRDDHIQRLHGHDAALSDVSGKAHAGARVVAHTDNDCAEEIGAARDAIDPTHA